MFLLYVFIILYINFKIMCSTIIPENVHFFSSLHRYSAISRQVDFAANEMKAICPMQPMQFGSVLAAGSTSYLDVKRQDNWRPKNPLEMSSTVTLVYSGKLMDIDNPKSLDQAWMLCFFLKLFFQKRNRCRVVSPQYWTSLVFHPATRCFGRWFQTQTVVILHLKKPTHMECYDEAVFSWVNLKTSQNS